MNISTKPSSTVLRLSLAVSLAVLGRAEFRPPRMPQKAPRSILAVQTITITLLLAGFRRAVRVPAELKANWMIQLAWRDAEQRFLSGVKRAAIVGIAWPALVALVPLHLSLMSERITALHVVVGLFYSAALVEVLFAGCTKVPFASAYEPLTNVKTLGPILLLFVLMSVYAFARIEQAALGTSDGVANFCIGLVAVFVAARAFGVWRRAGRQEMKFDEPPEPATQWLGLSG